MKIYDEIGEVLPYDGPRPVLGPNDRMVVASVEMGRMRDARGRFIKACERCGLMPADPPSDLCNCCDAYAAHEWPYA